MAKQANVDKTKLYALRREGEKEASEIVMNTETGWHDFKGICYLTPPDRGHMIKGKVGDATDNGFMFIADRGNRLEEWEFTEVTYDNFKEKYHKLVYGGEKLVEQCNSTKELEDYFHDNFPDYT